MSTPGADRVLVVGCGAVGSVFAGLLAKDGCWVEAVGRGGHFDAVRTRGIEIVGIWGEHRAELAACYSSPGDAKGPYGAILVACKAFQTDVLVSTLKPECLAPEGRVISLQNGLGNVEKLAAVFGSERVLGGRVIFGAEVARDGTVAVTVEAAPTLIGALAARQEAGKAQAVGEVDAVGHPDSVEKAEAGEKQPAANENITAASEPPIDAGASYWASRLRAAGIPAEATPAILGALWGKVFYNAALNPMGALLGLPYGELPKDPERRRVMDRVIEEAFAVAVADGVALPWKDAGEYLDLFHQQLLPATVLHRSSMLQDLEKRRPTEIDAICGEVCRRGESHGIDVWANRVLLALVLSRSDQSAS